MHFSNIPYFSNLTGVFLAFIFAGSCESSESKSEPMYSQIGQSRGRPWSTDVSVEVRYIVRSQDTGEALGVRELTPKPLDRAIWFSPSGKHFFFMTQSGEIASDSVRYEMFVYSVMAVEAALQNGHSEIDPLRHVTERTRSAGSAITDAGMHHAHWETDETIVYTVSTRIFRDAIYRLNVTTGEVERVTGDECFLYPSNTDIQANAVTYLTATQARKPLEPDPAGQPISGLYYQWLSSGQVPAGEAQIWAGTRPGNLRCVASYPASYSSANPMPPRLSPDRRWAVTALPAFEENFNRQTLIFPSEWKHYAGLDRPSELSSAMEYFPIGDLSPASYRRLWRPTLIDVETGQIKTIVDAPLGPDLDFRSSARAFWAEHGGSFILTNVCLPLGGVEKQDRENSYLVSYDTKRDQLTPLEPMVKSAPDGQKYSVKAIGWLEQGRRLLVMRMDEAKKPAVGSLYQVTASGWQRTDADPAISLPDITAGVAPRAPDGLQIEIREAANEPANVVATNGKVTLPLLKSDPALANIAMAKVQLVEWRERGGRFERGGLYLPVNYDGKAPLPLVVQIRNYVGNPNPVERYFLPDSTAKGGSSAQALAAKGIAVLAIEGYAKDIHPELAERNQPGVAKWKWELEPMVERVDAAVRELVRTGIADKNRIGVVGFSRTGYFVNYLCTHPGETVPLAAVVNDANTNSYGEYIVAQAIGLGTAADYERQYGGNPWENIRTWSEQTPSMNVHRVETAMLFTYHRIPESFVPSLSIPETFTAFRRMRREADFLLFTGSHQIQTPSIQRAELQANIDWMAFWLLGHEDKDPAKEKNYRYWRVLKKQRDERWAKEAKLKGQQRSFMREQNEGLEVNGSGG